MKKVYQNIGFKAVNLNEGEFEIENKYAFTNLDQFSISWSIMADGAVLKSGKISDLNVLPGAKKQIKLDTKLDPVADTEYFITFSYNFV